MYKNFKISGKKSAAGLMENNFSSEMLTHKIHRREGI